MRRAAILLAGLTLALLLAMAFFRPPPARAWGDEGTFLAMTASLASELDLRFEAPDRARVEAADGGRTYLILQRAKDGVFYSKPVLFPLLAAPFYALFGEWGPVVLNLLALGLALWLAYAYLARLGMPERALLTLVTFAGCAVLVPYAFWRMSDSLQASVALVGLLLSFARARAPSPRPQSLAERVLCWRGAPYLGAALLASLIAMRLTNGAVAVVPVLAALLEHRSWRRRLARAAALAAVVAGVYLACAGLTAALTGVANPYRATRSTFTPETGYPGSGGDAMRRFEELRARESTGLRPRSGVRQVGYATGYFFLGRHTGLLFYFPAACVFLVLALRRTDPIGQACLIGFAAALVFFLVWRTDNYFGGDTFIGNRYFLSLYPLLLLALPHLPRRRALAAAWMLAGLGYASALVSVVRHHDVDPTSQSHAREGIYRLLPYESTAREIAGRRDRYWTGHFLRFVDPFAQVGGEHFELAAGRPPAEVLIAHWQPHEVLRLHVETAAPYARLEVRDYGRRRLYRVGVEHRGLARGPLGVAIDLEPSPAWRLHRYWWDPAVLYRTRALRLRLEHPGALPARAVVRYAGPAG